MNFKGARANIENWKNLDVDDKFKLLNSGAGFYLKKDTYLKVRDWTNGTKATQLYLYFGTNSELSEMYLYLINNEYDKNIEKFDEDKTALICLKMNNEKENYIKNKTTLWEGIKDIERIRLKAELIKADINIIGAKAEAIATKANTIKHLSDAKNNEGYCKKTIKELEQELQAIMAPRQIIGRAFRWLAHGKQWCYNDVEGSNALKEKTKCVQVFTISVDDFNKVLKLNDDDPTNDLREAFIFFGMKDYTNKDEDPATTNPLKIAYESELEILVCAKTENQVKNFSSEANFLGNYLPNDISSPYPPFKIDPPVFNLLP